MTHDTMFGCASDRTTRHSRKKREMSDGSKPSGRSFFRATARPRQLPRWTVHPLFHEPLASCTAHPQHRPSERTFAAPCPPKPLRRCRCSAAGRCHPATHSRHRLRAAVRVHSCLGRSDL